MKKIGLSLGGGGARGICHIEFLKIFDELDVKPSIISGTSIGAIIGAFYAAGHSGKYLEELLDEIGMKSLHSRIDFSFKEKNDADSTQNFSSTLKNKITDIKDLYSKISEIQKMIDFSFFNNKSFLKGKGVTKFFEKKLGAKTFSELKIPLKIVAADYWKGEEVIFTEGDLVAAIRASMSIPGIFEPVVIDDKVLIDGGVTNNLPYDLLKDCDIIIAIDVSGSRKVPAKNKLPNWFDNMMISYEILQSSIVDYQMNLSKPDIYIKPQLEDVGILEFHKAPQILKSVKNDGLKFKKELIQILND